MDKNFVNIDDLVRQRLGGGEETERTGAWLQMRDLLDQEMPQSKAGFIFWRRLFSAIAVLVLISTMSIGGYMYTTSVKGNNDNNNSDNNDLATNISSNTTTITTNEINNSNQLSNTAVSSHMDLTDKEHANKQNDQKTTGIVKPINKQILASNTTPLNSSKHHSQKHEQAKNHQFLTQLIAANEQNKQDATKNATPIIAPVTNKVKSTTQTSGNSARINKPNNQNNLTKENNKIASSGKSTGNNKYSLHTDKTDKTKRGNSSAIAANNNTPATHNSLPATRSIASKTENNIRSAAANNNNNSSINTHKLALSSNTPNTKNISGVNATNTINSSTKSQTHNSKPAFSKASSKSLVAVNNKNNSAEDASAENDNRPAPHKIERIAMSEHIVQTTTGETYFKLDTISISDEFVNEQLGLSNQHGQKALKNVNKPSANSQNTLPGTSNAVANSQTLSSSSSTPNIPGTNSMQSSNAAQSSGNTTILPAASASSQSGMGIKEAQTAKMGSGTSTAEKLSATFNDIKFHVASAQFAPGLTAGINGTFFGPSSFKGFQFGVTGNFIFGDNFSILTELEYFRRMNNNYSLTDNTYTYTQTGGGQYTKITTPFTYNFSTLQSIEMPISIRYCKSHFNFYVGGNIVYTFTINTAEAGSTPVSTTVSAAGSNTESQIKVSDFDSKFGLGYLLGISYQITPNVMLDFRNVQTVWDNASTPGAKIISNQLYKSPSLQVSIGVRLGGNKDKNKDQ